MFDEQKFRQEINEDFKQHIEVLYEKFHTDIQLLAEQQQDTNRKVDMLIETVGDIKVEITEINEKLDNKVDRSEFLELKQEVAQLKPVLAR